MGEACKLWQSDVDELRAMINSLTLELKEVKHRCARLEKQRKWKRLSQAGKISTQLIRGSCRKKAKLSKNAAGFQTKSQVTPRESAISNGEPQSSDELHGNITQWDDYGHVTDILADLSNSKNEVKV